MKPLRQIDPDSAILDFIADLNSRFATAFDSLETSPAPIRQVISIPAIFRGDEDAAISRLIKVVDSNFVELFEAVDQVPPARLHMGPLHKLSMESVAQDIQRVADLCFAALDAGGAVTITSDGGGSTVSLDAAESQTAVTTIAATQAEPSGDIIYSISGGADAALFAINASSGVLTFADAPVFATPTDANTNGVYEVTVKATGRGGVSDTQAISVTVTEGDAVPANALILNGQPLMLNGQVLTLGA